MLNIPENIERYLSTALIDGREPACLQAGSDGMIAAASGNLQLYGLGGLKLGKGAAEQAPLLVGLLQRQESASFLPQVQTSSGRYADLHVVPDGEAFWVIFLDAEEEHARRAYYQQKANELSLLREREARQAEPHEFDSTAIPAGLLARLEIVAIELSDDGRFRILGSNTPWFSRLYPESSAPGPLSDFTERFPFLENFLFDARDFWAGESEGCLKSGSWTETTSSGEEINLEASAIRVDARHILLIERQGSRYEDNRSLLQKARELSLEEQRRLKETQKKEILLHCIVHDLAGPLTGIKGCLSLLKFENISPKGKELLEAGLRQAAKQEKWIRTILEVFSAEVASLESYSRDGAEAPDAALCAQDVIQALLPAASAEKLHLRLSPSVDLQADWKVAGERSRLERILFNLAENALRHTAPASTVTLELHREGNEIVVAVDDEGPGIPPAVAANLFQKFSQGEGHTGKAGLGLYFCRITVERWGGEIGCHSLPERGARFWFRLPAIGASERGIAGN